MLLNYEKPKEKTLTQKHCRSKIEKLAEKPIKPTDSCVCYQFNQNPYEKAYILNKKYEELFQKLGKLYQKSDAIHKILIEKKVKNIFATVGLIAFIGAFGVSDTNIQAPNIKALEESENDFDLKPAIEQSIAFIEDLQEEKENRIEEMEDIDERTNFKSIYKEEIEKRAMYDAYLTEYSNYFNYDSEKVITLAREATNHYDESFANIITNSKYDLSNPEAACMLFVYELQLPKEKSNINYDLFKTTFDNLKESEEIRTIPHNDLKTLKLQNGYQFSKYIEKICNLFHLSNLSGYDGKTAVLSLSFIEAGQKGSKASKERNNYFGITGETDLLNYATPESCIISITGNLYNNYSHIMDLEQLAWKYNSVPENIEQWKSNFLSAYYKIENNYEEYFEPKDDLMHKLRRK